MENWWTVLTTKMQRKTEEEARSQELEGVDDHVEHFDQKATVLERS